VTADRKEGVFVGSGEQGILREEARTAVLNLIEKGPILKRLAFRFGKGTGPNRSSDLLPAKLQLACIQDQCVARGPTTWVRDRQSDESWVGGTWVVYKCSHCDHGQRIYWLRIEEGEREAKTAPEGRVTRHPGEPPPPPPPLVALAITKLGQSPIWAPELPNRLEKNLTSSSKELLKKGVACLGQSYGIGACAYFRRLIEDESGAILDVVQKQAEADGDDAVLENLKQARVAKTADERVKIASQHVPRTLKPGGREPLKILYGVLSGPLHSETEEQSMQRAVDVFETLKFLFVELKEHLDRRREYAASLHQLADPKAEE
jgi:hypothetical protein